MGWLLFRMTDRRAITEIDWLIGIEVRWLNDDHSANADLILAALFRGTGEILHLPLPIARRLDAEIRDVLSSDENLTFHYIRLGRDKSGDYHRDRISSHKDH